MKVSELQGAELDYWVAKAEGKVCLLNRKKAVCYVSGCTEVYSPSTDWSRGGPIIDRDGITVEAIWPISGALPVKVWHAERNSVDYQFGTTPLIAAMRCYVATNFGVTVDDSQTD
jgi:hypothetical protein